MSDANSLSLLGGKDRRLSSESDIRAETPNAAEADAETDTTGALELLRQHNDNNNASVQHSPAPPPGPQSSTQLTYHSGKRGGGGPHQHVDGVEYDEGGNMVLSDSIASLPARDRSPPLYSPDSPPGGNNSTNNSPGSTTTAAARRKQNNKAKHNKQKRRKTAEEMAEERRRIDAAMSLLDEAKKKARAQRQDYGNYLSWKVTMQRQEHKLREQEEAKLRDRVDQKLQQVLSEHRELRRKELTAYRHFAHETPSTLHQTLGTNNDSTMQQEEMSQPTMTEDGPTKIRVPARRLQLTNSFAEEDAHFQSYMVEQERKREEWARTKSLLHTNAMKASSLAQSGATNNALHHQPGDISSAHHRTSTSTTRNNINVTNRSGTNYAEVFAQKENGGGDAQRRPNDGYAQVKDTTTGGRSAASQVATNLQRLARTYDMQPAPTRAAVAAAQRRKKQPGQPLSSGEGEDGGGVDEESALMAKYQALIVQTGGGGKTPICSMGPGGAATLVDPTTGMTLEYVVEDSSAGGPLQPTSVDDALTIVKRNKLTQAEHEMLVKTSHLRHRDGQRRLMLDDMMTKARTRKADATELLTLDPPADYIIANGLDRLLPTDLLQLAHDDQRSTDSLVHGKLKRKPDTYYLLDHEDNELNTASRKKLKGVLAQRRSGNDDDTAFFITEVTGDDIHHHDGSMDDQHSRRQTHSAPTTAGGSICPSPPSSSMNRKLPSSSMVQVHRVPRTTKSSWYPKFTPNPYLVTPLATKKELDSLVQQRQLVPGETLSPSATTTSPQKGGGTIDSHQPPALAAIDFKSFNHDSNMTNITSPSRGSKIVLDTLATLQGGTGHDDDHRVVLPFQSSSGKKGFNDTTTSSSSTPFVASSDDPPPPKVVAVRFPPRNHQEEKAIYDWHTKRESVTVHSKIREQRNSSTAAANAVSTSGGQQEGWKHKSKPFLPPLKSMFVDPDLETARKFLHTKRTV